MKLCECGCGQETNIRRGKSRRFINGHQNRGENNSFYGKTGENSTNWKGGKITKTCIVCGKEFQVKLSKEHRRKCCSRNCRGIYQTKERITKTCLVCNKQFQVVPSREHARFCSRSCQNIYQTGKDAPMYGKTGENAPMYGYHHSEETRKKMSENSPHISGKDHPMYGRTGENNPNYGNKWSWSEESRRKMSATHQGIPYDEWEEYATDQKYCPLFTEACRESNREKYDRKCFICGLLESENITLTGKQQKLSVHHVDMDKGQGCDGKRWKLVPTCLHHHNLHNDLWMSRVIYLLNNCW